MKFGTNTSGLKSFNNFSNNQTSNIFAQPQQQSQPQQNSWVGNISNNVSMSTNNMGNMSMGNANNMNMNMGNSNQMSSMNGNNMNSFGQAGMFGGQSGWGSQQASSSPNMNMFAQGSSTGNANMFGQAGWGQNTGMLGQGSAPPPNINPALLQPRK